MLPDGDGWPRRDGLTAPAGPPPVVVAAIAVTAASIARATAASSPDSDSWTNAVVPRRLPQKSMMPCSISVAGAEPGVEPLLGEVGDRRHPGPQQLLERAAARWVREAVSGWAVTTSVLTRPSCASQGRETASSSRQERGRRS
ncbi:hypothetical protein GCM10009616_16820 [Microlunatus lacustris]